MVESVAPFQGGELNSFQVPLWPASPDHFGLEQLNHPARDLQSMSFLILLRPLLVDIIRTEVARQYVLTVSEVESWIDVS